MTNRTQTKMSSLCLTVVLMVSLVPQMSTLSLRATKLNNNNSEGKVTSTLAKVTAVTVPIGWRREPLPEGSDNISEKRSSSDSAIFQPDQVRGDTSRDLQYKDETSSDKSLSNNFHSSSKNRKTVHMSVESKGTQNITNNYFDKKEMFSAGQIDTVSKSTEQTIGDDHTGHSSQSLLGVYTDTNDQTIIHGRSTSHMLETTNAESRVPLTTDSSQFNNGKRVLVLCNHSCCNISDNIAICSGCHLKCVPSDLPQNISKLLLDRNGINTDDLSSGVFSSYPELEELNLDSNNITILPEGVFDGLGKLKTLSIYNNSITLNVEFNKSLVFLPLKDTLKTLIINRNTKDKRQRKKILVYPDHALSVLQNLSCLHIDGLKDTQFGIGFNKLTKLTTLSMAGYHRGYCYMKSIKNDTFQYLSYLINLDISNCNLKGSQIAPLAFSPLSRLQVLDVSFNSNLGINHVGNFMYGLQNNNNFVHLKMTKIVPRFAPCIIVYKHTLRYFQNSSLQVIEAMDNEIEMIEGGALQMLPSKLKIVNLTNNRIMFGAYWRDMASLTELKTLNLDIIKQAQFPSLFPSTKWHCLEYNFSNSWNIEQKQEWECPCGIGTCSPENSKFVLPLPPKLKQFTMHSNSLAYKIAHLEFCATNNLTTVDLSDNAFQELEGPITGLNNIKDLKLTSCFIERIKDHFFDTLPSLENLNLFQNLLGDQLFNDTDGKIFEPLTNLKSLNMSFNNLYRLNKESLKNLRNLEVLDLSTNRLSHIGFKVDHMTKLQFLDIHKNDISSLPKGLMDLVDNLLKANMSVQIDMSANPISCECPNLEFLEWVVTRKVFGHNFTFYYCKYNIANQTSIEMKDGYDEEVVRLRRYCSTQVGLFFGVAGGTLLLVVLIIGLLLYRFRWTLRYWFHAAKLKIYSNPQQPSQKFDYDVFISYANEDVNFIIHELSLALSSRRHLSLMVHGETFQAGRHIADNIYMAVRQCRKTLVLVTRNMLTSHWCTYELQMARQESISTGRNVLLFLFLEEIPTHLISVDVMSYIKSSTYIMYPQDVDHREAFWDKLADDLRAP